MWGLVLAGLVVVFALDSERGRDKAKVKLGADGKPVKEKSADELKLEIKAEGRKEAEAEFKAKADHEKRIRTMVRREMRYRPPSAASGGGDES